MLVGLILCRSCYFECPLPPHFTLACWLAWSHAGLVHLSAFPSSHWDADWLYLVQVLCRQLHLLWVHECRDSVMSRRVSPHSSLFCLSQSLRPFSAMVPETWEGSSYRCHICDEALCRHLPSSVSLLWVSAFTTIHCAEKLPWWGARAALNYGYLRRSLSICSLSKIIVISWPTETVCYKTWDLGQIYSIWHVFLLVFWP